MRIMRKLIFILLLSTAAFVTGCKEKAASQPKIKDEMTEGVYGDSIPITRGEAARMLALCMYGYDDILNMENKAEFSDVDVKDKLYKYINALYTDNIMLGEDKSFRPEDYLSVKEASYIIDAADSSGRISLETDEGTENNPISYYMWVQILEKFTEAGDVAGGAESVMTVLMTESADKSLEGYMLSDKGLFRTDGFVPATLENISLSFLVSGDTVIAIKTVNSNTPTLQKCLVLGINGNRAEVFFGGCKKIYITEEKAERENSFIADITINGNHIESMTPYTSEKYGKIIMAGDTLLFDDGFSYNIDEGFLAYSTYDGIVTGSLTSLTSGNSARVIFKDNKAVCAICEEAPSKDTIRVCISGDGGGLSYDSLSIGSDKGFSLKSGDYSSDFEKNDTLILNKGNENSYFRGKLIKLIPKDKGNITVDEKSFPGTIDVIRGDLGYSAVSEMSIEEYLYGVVCSEMPSGWTLEALKAQAVAARTYARGQILSNRRLGYGGNVDDTTSFQVYSEGSICDEAKRAVDDTAGEMVYYDGKQANTCFYSTSCGVGASSGEIWSDGERYPSYTPEYLKAKRIGEGDIPDFSTEEAALSFFKLKNEGGLEKEAPYYRWSFTTSLAALKADDISVTKRGEGGNVMEVLIEGEDEDRTVIGEGNIRGLLSPVNVKLSDGSTVSLKSLPSSFFAIETMEDGTVCFYGGGLGHGAGLSQYGAKALADEGKDYKDILKYFYPGCDIKK